MAGDKLYPPNHLAEATRSPIASKQRARAA
jgi:hypothetical protein